MTNLITQYLLLPAEERLRLWLSADFAAKFPSVVRDLLSPEGLERYSEEDCSVFFHVGVGAMVTYPLVDLGAHLYLYTFSSAQASILGGITIGPDTDSLVRVNLAGLILLGMSQSNHEKSLLELAKACSRSDPSSKYFMLQHLELLLSRVSSTRQWVVQNYLDVAAGRDWDSFLAELVLKNDRYAIDPVQNSPKRLPRFLLGPSAPGFYSVAVFEVFLDYAVEFVCSLPLTTTMSRDLVSFMINVRRMNREFVLKPQTQYALAYLNQMVNAAAGQKVGVGSVPAARELLVGYKRHGPGIRWYQRGVVALLT